MTDKAPTAPTDPLSRIEAMEETRPPSFILERLKRLIQPSPQGPEAFNDDLIAAAVNAAFDRAAKKTGVSAQAQVGQSFMLCLEAVLGTTAVGILSSPLGRLIQSIYRWNRIARPAKEPTNEGKLK